ADNNEKSLSFSVAERTCAPLHSAAIELALVRADTLLQPRRLEAGCRVDAIRWVKRARLPSAEQVLYYAQASLLGRRSPPGVGPAPASEAFPGRREAMRQEEGGTFSLPQFAPLHFSMSCHTRLCHRRTCHEDER